MNRTLIYALYNVLCYIYFIKYFIYFKNIIYIYSIIYGYSGHNESYISFYTKISVYISDLCENIIIYVSEIGIIS